MVAPRLGADRIARIGQGGNHPDGGDQQPAQPDRCALSAFAHPVHPVVPIAGADQRQTVRPGQGNALVNSPGTMFKQAGGLVRQHGLKEIIMCAGLQLRAFDERDLLVKNGRVTGDPDVVGYAIAQPNPVVRDSGAHPLARMRQPPMLHVALGKLPGGGPQQMAAGHLWAAKGQRHAVLQLVPETIGPAGLVKPGPCPNTGCKGLIQQPAIQHDIHAAIGGFDLNGGQQIGPMAGDLRQHRVQIGDAIPPYYILRLFQRGRLPEQQPQVHRLPRLQGQHPLQRGTGVQRCPGPARQRARQPVRIGHRAAHPHHLGPVSGPAGHFRANIGKADAARKRDAPGVAGQQCAGVCIHLRGHKP